MMTPDEFVLRWEKSGGAEMANSQLFLTELCDLLDVPHPDGTTTDTTSNKYVFEKAVEFNNGDGTVSKGRVDLFKAGCFVLESKQGSERKAAEAAEALATKTKIAKKLGGTAKRGTPSWDRAMQAARRQAKGYAEAIPDEWPPFLIVTDVGFCFDIYADFSGTGKNYVPFPDPRGYRIHLGRLREERIRNLLRAVWTNPASLDPSKISAKVTREIAERLAKLAKSLEADHSPEVVSGFLMRCLFTMFAEDVELLRPESFTELLLQLRTEPHNFKPMAEALWESMDEGKFSTILREKVKQFNGKFFKDKTALPLNHDQVELLVEAAQYRWEEVEPAIFGTLLERALDPVERHKLGAHYTPRAYVERLVMPTVIEPLRQQWDATYAAATQLDEDDKRKDARKLLREFHGRLCETRVLDPACGSGNFLYVAMELMKRLEGEVLNAMSELGDNVLPGLTIDPHQFLGIEINPRAAALAELVLWIGSIQWYKRTRDTVNIPEPILKDYGNIECRDAVLDWDDIEPVTDDDGKPVTRWDGRTTKPHPVTGEEVPDETARVQEQRYINPREAKWPEADYIVGNPPFVGNKKMRSALGTGYVDALHKSYKDVPNSVDYVMIWWHKAANCVVNCDTQRFGLITTNSIHQYYSRKLVRTWLSGDTAMLTYAIPDHPWVDTQLCAAVRIAMTVGEKFDEKLSELGILKKVVRESRIKDEVELDIEWETLEGFISPSLTVGSDPRSATPLEANDRLCWQGCKLVGSGFQVARDLSTKYRKSDPRADQYLRNYWTGSDITKVRRDRDVIDFFGLSSDEARDRCPTLYQHLVDHVKQYREGNNDETFRKKWWLFGRPRPEMREALADLEMYFITSEVSEHRVFEPVRWPTDLVDGGVIAIASNDYSMFGIIQSRIHVTWSVAAGGRMGKGNTPRYQNSFCFDPFPFPSCSEEQTSVIRLAGLKIAEHRASRREKYPALTLLSIYNVLEKLRAGETLTTKEQSVHEQGLVSVLGEIHDDLDAAVFDAYGWPHDLDDEAILQRLVDLNHERAEEESRGIVRWLRPDFQNPDGATQTSFAEGDKAKPAKKATKAKIKKQRWPKTLPDRVAAVQSALHRHAAPADVKQVAAYYTRAKKDDIAELLETLTTLGNVRQLDDGRFTTVQ